MLQICSPQRTLFILCFFALSVRILPSRKPPREQKNEKIEKFEKMLAKHLKFAELLEH
jgi:hypothetical protein